MLKFVEQNMEAIRVLHENGIGILQGLILFDFRITMEELRNNVNYVINTEGNNAGKIGSVLVLYHGTELFNKYCDDTQSHFSPIYPAFLDERIERIYHAYYESSVWGAELFNKIEDMIWDCYFKYDIIVPDTLYQMNKKLNQTLCTYLLEIIDAVAVDSPVDAIQQQITRFLMSESTRLKRYEKEFRNKFDLNG